mmetsp:Transcript_8030/g.15497  ORF Transcript_8030/g.15497 Transcript_8030/m.15497 type:complete len:498 (+) Transcript_8030:657-2150(+)
MAMRPGGPRGPARGGGDDAPGVCGAGARSGESHDRIVTRPGGLRCGPGRRDSAAARDRHGDAVRRQLHVAGDLKLGQRVAMHLVRAVGQAQGALVGPHHGQRGVVGHAHAAEDLDGPVDDLQRHIGRDDLDHRDLGLGDLVAHGVHHVGGLERQQPRLLDHAARLGNALLRDGLLGDGLAEGGAGDGALAHQLQRTLGRADAAHAVVDAAGAEAPLGDLEAAAFAEQDVGGRYAHILQLDLHVAVGRVVVAEHRQRADDGDAGRVGRHDDHGLLLVAARLGVGLAHHDVDGAARVAGTAAPPLAAVDDVVIAVALDAAFDIGGVAGRHGRLGHQEGRADLAAQQGLQPAVLQRLAGIALQRLHVAGVGRRAVEDLGRPEHPAHDLAQRRVFEVAQALGRAAGLGQKQVPQPGGARLGLEFLDHGGGQPGVAGTAVGGDFVEVALFVGRDVLGKEGEQALAQLHDLGGIVEVHGAGSVFVCRQCGAAAAHGLSPRHQN